MFLALFIWFVLVRVFTNGYYYDGQYYGTAAINTSQSSISINSSWTRVVYNGQAVSGNTIEVYYR